MPNDVFAGGVVMRVSVEGLREAQQRLTRANDAVSGRGLLATMHLAVGQIHRFLMGLKRDYPPPGTNILPVRTGRLANSIFFRVLNRGNDIIGVVGSNVDYGPQVERRRRFMEHTRQQMQQPTNDLFGRQIRLATRG